MSHPSPLTILLIDDCAEDRVAYCRFLQQDIRYTYHIVEFETATEAITWCQEVIPDVILLDFMLPDCDGLEFLQQFRERRVNTQSSVIILTGQGDETIAVRAMKSGAQDYLVKGQLTAEILQRTIHNTVERIALNRQLQQSREQQLIAAIALRIRQSLKLEEILRITAKEVRQFLKADRVLIYQFHPDMSGTVVAESVLPAWTVFLGTKIQETCFQQAGRSDYRRGQKWAVDDIYQAGLTGCHLQLLEQFEVKANLVVPILVSDQLWGLLVAHQCSAPRHWEAVELELLDQLGVQLSLAIQQANTYQQLQAELTERKWIEAALQASEEKLKLTLDFAHIGYWERNFITNELFASDNAIRCFGYERSGRNVTSEELLSLIHPDDQEWVQRGLSQAIATQTDYIVESRVVWPDDSIHWISATGRAVYDDKGQPLLMLGVLIDISERKQAQEALQESEEQFRSTFEQAAVGMCHVSLSGQFLRFNQKFSEIAGYPQAKLQTLTFQEITHPDDLADDLQQVEKLLTGEIPTFSIEKRYIRQDSSIVWINLTVSLMRDRFGKPKYFISVIEDISSRKQTEAALHQNEERLNLALEAAGMGNWDWNIQTGEIYWSANLERMFGIVPESFTGDDETVVSIIHPDDRQSVLQAINAAIYQKQEYNIEFRFIKPDGTPRWALSRGRVFDDDKGNPTRMIGVDLDITERKQTEAILKESEERFRHIADSSPVLIWMSGIDKLCHYFNQSWLDFTGRTLEPELGNGWAEAVHPDDYQYCLDIYVNAFDARQNFQMEYRLQRFDGEYRWILDKGIPRFTSEGDFLGYMGSCIDISDRILAEQALQQFNQELEARVEQRTAALRESEERWQLALRGSNDGIWDWNLKTNQVFFSTRWKEMRGFAEDEISSTIEEWWSRIHPDDYQRFQTALADHFDQKTPFLSEEYRVQHKNDSYIWVLNRGQALWDTAGNVIRMSGAAKDITRRKLAEAELLALSNLQQAILDGSDYAIISTNSEGLIQTFNAGAQKMLSYSPEDVINQLPDQLHDLAEIQQRSEILSWELGRTIASGLEFFTAKTQQEKTYEDEWTYIRKNGDRFPVLLSVTCLRNQEGQPLGFLGIAKDITQQKQMEAELRKSAAHLASAQHIACLGSWEFDFQTQQIIWSAETFRIFGLNRQSAMPTYEEFRQLIHPDDREHHEVLVKQTIEQGQPYEYEYRSHHSNGTLIYLSSRGEVIFDTNGKPLRLVGTIQDITNRKQTEEQLRSLSNRLTLALKSGAIGTWDWDMIHDAHWDDRMYELYNMQRSEGEAVYQDWVNALHPDDRAPAEANFQAALQGEKEFDTEFRAVHPDGSIHFIKAAGIVQHNQQGEPQRMVGINYDITERKQIEAALKESERRYATLTEASPVAIFRIDADGNCVYMNERWSQMTDRPAQSALGMGWLDAVHPEDREYILLQRSQTLLKPGGLYRNEGRHLLADGSIRWFYCQLLAETHADGSFMGYIGTLTDITRRKKIEEALWESERRYASLAEASPVAIFRFDGGSNCVYVNERWSQMSGRPVEAALGMGWVDTLHPDDRDRMIREWVEEFERQGFYENEGRCLRPDGSIICFFCQAIPETDSNGSIIGYLGTLTDITDRKLAEIALKESERRYATLAQAAPVAIFRFDAAGNCIYVNERWCEMTGKPTQAALGMGWLESLYPEDRDRFVREWTQWTQVSVPGQLYQKEGRYLRPDGSINWFYGYALAETNPDGSIIGYVGTLTDITERKQTEEQLRKLSERLTLAIKSGGFGIWEWDMIHNVLIWDERMYELYSVQPCEFTGAYEAWIKRVHPDDRAAAENLTERAQRGEIEYDTEFRVVHPDGSIRYIKAYSLIERNQQGESQQMIGVNYDITESKIAEQELIHNQDLREAIYNESTDAIFLVDPQARLTIDCNRRAVELFAAANQADLIGINGQGLQRRQFSAQETAAIVQEMQLKGVWSGEIEYVTCQGNFFWGNIAAKPITVAGRTLDLVRITDISDRKEAEEIMATYTRELADLYNKAPCGYHSLDTDARFVNINDTELEWLGYSYEEIIGQYFVDYVTQASRSVFLENYPQFKKRGWVKDLEFDIICKDGTILPVLLNATAIKSEDGNYLCSRSSIIDIRDRKQAEEQLRQTNQQLANANVELARATRLKDEFLANMSHELRTPLNAILGMSEGLQECVFGVVNERQIKAISTIERSGKHLLELINDILDLSKIESGKLELQLSDVPVRTLCDASISFIKQMALTKNIGLSTRIANNLGNIQVDDRRLRQVLINLLSNAIKFTPEGGFVRLEVSLEQAGELLNRGAEGDEEDKEANSPPSSHLCFSVIDTGIGISPEDISKLFQPFIQLDSSLNRHYNGTGLGLALVQRIATLHGGTVLVNSEVGQGSCFTFRIPHKISDHLLAMQVNALFPSYSLRADNAQVLIIEDSIPAAEQITRYLSEMGMQPIVYPRGEGSVEEALRVQPALILLDLQLPNLSGWDVLNQLQTHSQTKEIPVIIISVIDERSKGIAHGAAEYIVKPITRERFQATLEKLQHSARPDSPALIVVPKPIVESPLILLAEDNQANIDTMSGYLESRGYRLIQAKNGQQAIELARTQRPDLIVMDIQMPIMDGLEAMRRLRQERQFAHLPIIALTALAMPGDREICLDAGASEYLSKPIKLKLLVVKIQQLLGS